MKKCANCDFEVADEEINCPSCSMETFVSSSPEALGHVIGSEEQRFWQRMTFWQFAIVLIRVEALWLFFYAFLDAIYVLEYFQPGVRFTLHAKFLVLRVGLFFVSGFCCVRYPHRLISWLVKDMVPKTPTNGSSEPPASTE